MYGISSRTLFFKARWWGHGYLRIITYAIWYISNILWKRKIRRLKNQVSFKELGNIMTSDFFKRLMEVRIPWNNVFRYCEQLNSDRKFYIQTNNPASGREKERYLHSKYYFPCNLYQKFI